MLTYYLPAPAGLGGTQPCEHDKRADPKISLQLRQIIDCLISWIKRLSDWVAEKVFSGGSTRVGCR